MGKKIFKETLKQVWFYLLSYVTHFLVPAIKEAALQAKNNFIETLWESVKEDFSENAKSAVSFVERFFESATYKEKEEEVMDILFKNVNLPLLLKPFKPLLKKILHDKVHALISSYLKKLNSKF